MLTLGYADSERFTSYVAEKLPESGAEKLKDLASSYEQKLEVAAHKELQTLLADKPETITKEMFSIVSNAVTRATPITFPEAARTLKIAATAWEKKHSL